MEAKRVNQRIRITKKIIHESLIELLEEKPVNKITVSELCKKSEINRSTFYKHYESVYDILEEIGKDIIYKIESTTSIKNKEKVLSLEEQVYEMGTFFKNNPEEAKFLLKYFSADDPIIQNLFLKRITTGQINYTFSNKEINPNAQKLLFEFLIHGIYNLIKCWILEDIAMSPKEIGQLATEIARNGWIKE